MTRIILIFIFVIQYLTIIAQKPPQITLNPSSVGVIKDKKGKILGTGFVVELPNQVVTCEHVLTVDTVYFHPSNNINQRFLLLLNQRMKAEDIAILESIEDTISKQPFKIGNPQKHNPGDGIFYIGYNQEASTSKNITFIAHYGIIKATGKVVNNNKNISFFEFIGEGIPGYSGAPLINTEGKIIGVFREAWTMKGLKKDSPEVLINRAFSIYPVIQHITKKSKKRRHQKT